MHRGQAIVRFEGNCPKARSPRIMAENLPMTNPKCMTLHDHLQWPPTLSTKLTNLALNKSTS